MTETLLVTGASGQLGRAVIRHLLETRGVDPSRLIAVTRDPGKLADLAAKGVDVRAGDFSDPAGLDSAFHSAGKLLLISTDTVDKPGERLRQHQNAVAAAQAAGASRIYYTSMPEPEPGSPITFAGDHYGTEQAIKATGLPYTIFRNGWYQENLMMSLPGAFARGVWPTSAGDGKIAHVARDDIAAAIAGALVSNETGNATYTLTGATALTTAEVAALASEVVGKPVQIVQLSDEALLDGVKAAGLPEPVARIVVSFDTNTRAGRIAMVTNAVEQLSGRKLAPLRIFLEAQKAALLSG